MRLKQTAEVRSLIDQLRIVALQKAIKSAAETTLNDLYNSGERFYFFTMTTSGDGGTPSLSAWSYEALERSSADKTVRDAIRWSYADSPYCAYRYTEYWGDVARLLSERPAMDFADAEQWEREGTVRMEAMIAAVQELDEKGLFSRSLPRNEVLVVVEYMPPDATNTSRAYRLNDPETHIFRRWLNEAAEPLE